MKLRNVFLSISLVFLFLCQVVEAAPKNGAPDTIPPTVSLTSPPTGTTFTSAVTVTIVATASDNVKVSKVEFYDNGVYKGYDPRKPYTFNWSITSADNGAHDWTAKAYDRAGNISTSSVVVLTANIGAADTTPPSVSITSPPSGTTYTTAQSVTITASASDNVGVTRVEFYDGTVLKATDTSAPYSYAWTFTGADNSTHNWTAKAYDAANNSSVSNVVSLIVNIDITPPSVPTGLTATALSCDQINLGWNASTDTGGSGLKGYKVYRNGSFLKQVTTTSATDTGLSASTSYSYTVSSIDNANNESAQCSSANATTPQCPDTTPPSVFITSPPSGTTYTTAQTVTITASASDNVGVTKVEFYDGSTLRGTDTTSPYNYVWTFTGSDNGTHNWTAKAYDAANNSSVSNTVSLIVNIDITAPSVPTGVTATAVSCSQINLSWNASTDTGGSGLKGYNVHRNGSFLKQVTTTSTTDTGLSASTNYSYTVSSIDNANNESAQSASASDTTPQCPDTTPPSVSITTPPSGTTYTTAQTVTINASASDNIGVAKVEFYDGSILKATDTSAPYNYAWSFTGADNGNHNWTAKAYDAAGNVTSSSTVSLTVNIVTDTTPPSVPAGLTATAVSSSQIDLRWNPSTDTGGSGLAGYKVYRATTQIATTTATNYSDNGLAANTQYCYQVASYDNAGNNSAKCTQVCATTQADSQPGAHLWSKGFSSSRLNSYDYNYGEASAVDPSDNVIVTGYFEGKVDFGG
ncbi:MAG: Ig-like domain-containing protein, partial [Nitrospirota bacterium]